MASVWLETHGKAVVVKGDTMMIKDLLKSKGGKWNGGLKSWIFPGSKKAAVIEDLQSSDKVKSVEDRTDGSSAPASQAPAKKTAPAAAKATPAKRAAAQTNESGEKVFELVDEVRVTISSFRTQIGVDIRKFYTEKVSGELRPTPKGIRLSKEEWEALCNAVATVDAALQKDGEESWNLVGDVQVSITAGAVDIRRYYVDKNDGQSKPGKKGIRLGPVQWPSLKAEMTDITKEVDQGAGAGGPPPKKAKNQKSELPDIPKEAETPDEDSTKSRAKWKHELRKILKGRDLKELSLRKVRAELEAVLSLPADGLLEHKDEVKEIVTDLIQSGEVA